MKLISNAPQEPPTITGEGAERRVLAYGGSLMLVEFTFKAGTTALWHSHPHEQVSYVVSGEIDFNLDGHEPVRLVAGGSYYVPPNVKHNIITHAPSLVIDAFTPHREEFLKP